MTTEALKNLAEAGVVTGAPPHPATIVQTGVPGVSYAVSVTAEQGLQVEQIDTREEAAATPLRVNDTRVVSDLPSFLAELDRRGLNDAGTLWGNADRGEIQAVYNDHVGDHAGDRDDRLKLVLTADRDWTAWHKLSGQFVPQDQFGDIVEDLRHTITSPDQADLLEIIDSVRASTRGEFESTIERARGGQKLTYKKEVNAKAGAVGRELEVPQTITLSLRPWEGHPNLYDVNAYFRLNITEGHLKLAVKLFPTREILRQAWADVTTKVTEAIDKPVYSQP
jgi:hypothetical protein